VGLGVAVVEDQLARVEAAVAQLRSTVSSLEQRITRLEAGPGGPAPAAAPRDVDAPRPPVAGVPRDPRDPIFVLSLIGRLFLVLAGGFFLRAMTEAGLLPPPAGITLAFLYGLSWLVLADRASRRGQAMSAVFHAVGAALVVFPLLVEATTRFGVLDRGEAAAGIFLLTGGLLLVAWRRRLVGVAWVTVVAAPLTSAVLLLKTGLVLPFALHLVALGAATLWLGYGRGWTAIRWPAALAANLAVAGLTVRALMPEHADALRVALLLQWSLLAAYVVSIALHSLPRRRAVDWFEMIQTAVALMLAFGGSLLLVQAGGRAAAIGVVSLMCGALCYAAVFLAVDRGEDPGHRGHYYTTLAVALVLAGAAFLLGAPWPGLVFAVLGVLAAALWARRGRPYLLFYATAYGLAASFLSGAAGYAAWALAARPSGAWAEPDAAMAVAAGAASLAAVLAGARPAPAGGAAASGLRFVLAALCVWMVSGCVSGWLAPVVAGAGGEGIDPGALATVRTGVLAVAVLAVAWIGRHGRFREWAWLVYPMLVLIGLKMIAQDFGQSRPATLFIALALFGAALIFAPRLKRRDVSAAPLPT
jgi:hypothetical protein